MKPKAFTMLELVIALAISGLTFLMLTRSSSSIMRTLDLYTKLQSLQRDLPVVRRVIGNYFSKSMVMTSAAVGATRSGMMIDGSGGILLGADLRPCSLFDPSNSMDLDNVTEVQLVCCDQDMNVDVVLPDSPFGTGATRTMNSFCDTPQGGLSIVLRNQSGVVSSSCYPDFEAFYMAEVGRHRARNQPLFILDFQAEFSKGGSDQVTQTQRLQIFEAIRGVDTFMVDCI